MPIPGASPTLRERLLSKIVMPGPATPCATWVGAYNRPGRTSVKHSKFHRRPVVQLGTRGSGMRYVAPLLLEMAGTLPAPAQCACHTCPTGTPPDGVYRCVDLAHLRWGTYRENEADKRR